jgi:radical SAM-linked protein
MRDVINKNLSEEQILAATGHAFDAGWQLMKLYFMLGLPLETEGDVDAIAELAGRIRKQGQEKVGRRLRLTLSASTFIPKPFTPFQWFPMDRVESYRAKQARLRKRLPRGVTFKHHDFEMSFLEGVFSRGDRALGRVIEAAYRRGCSFDGWTERLDMAAWNEAFREAGIDPEAYAYREIPLEAELPWEVVESLINRRWLRREHLRSREAATLEICGPKECHGCAPFARDCVQGVVAETTGRVLPPPAQLPAAATQVPASSEAASQQESAPAGAESPEAPPSPAYRYRARFTKGGRLRFLGHLDLMRLVTRAFRRAGVRLVHTQGFRPKPKLSFGPALGVGIASEAEHLDFDCRDYLSPEDFLERVNAGLPETIRFLALVPIGPDAAKLQDAVRLTCYSVSRGPLGPEEVRRRIEAFRRRPRHPVRRQRKGKVQEVDCVPLVEELGESDGAIRLSLRSVGGPSLRPQEVLAAIFGEDAAAGMELCREDMLVEYGGRLISPLVAGRASGRHGYRDRR